MQQPVYLDYAATTPVDPRVAEVLMAHLTQEGNFGNPASVDHPYGWKARHAVDLAREQVAAAIHAGPREIVWTSGATEAINLALKGAAFHYQSKGKHIVTMQTEHKAVLDTCQYLEQQGFEVTYLKSGPSGLLNIEDLKAALRPDTTLVSTLYVNNETGVIQDIEEIAKVVKTNNSLLHVDAVQAVGKIAIDLRSLPVDLMSFSAHKIYGPKGIGALYVRLLPKVRLVQQLHGGGHEYGLRSGTLPVELIAAMGEAFQLAKQDMDEEVARIKGFRDRIWDKIKPIPRIQLNGESAPRVCGILNVSIPGIDGETLIKAMPQLALASGAACNSAFIEASHVLQAMGVGKELASSSLRISLGRFTTQEEVDFCVEIIKDKVMSLL